MDAITKRFQPGPRLIDGSELNAMADQINASVGLVSPAMSIAMPVPADLAYDMEGLAFTLTDTGVDRAYASCSQSPEALFDRFSTARSAPDATYYIDVATGNDSTGNGSQGNKFKSIWKGVEAANAANVPTKLIITAGTYPRANNPVFGHTGASDAFPTVDIAYVSVGGRVVTGNFDQYATPSLDGTYTNCYSFSLANADRVVNLTGRTTEGLFPELVNVATPARCNITPGSWNLTTGTIYLNRADGAAVTNSNTRIYRGAITFAVTSPVNLFFGGTDQGDGFDFEGSNSGAVLSLTFTSLPAARRAIVLSGCTARYGGAVGANVNGMSGSRIHGVLALFNCDASANANDGFNFHNASGISSVMRGMTVNCTGYDNGRGNQSQNGWTSHEDVIGLDVAGYYAGNRGGTVRSIDTAKALLAGTFVADDLGDIASGGSLRPTAFRVDGTAEYWLWRSKISMAAAGYGLVAGASGSKIHKRDVWPSALAEMAVPGAVIDSW